MQGGFGRSGLVGLAAVVAFSTCCSSESEEQSPQSVKPSISGTSARPNSTSTEPDAPSVCQGNAKSLVQQFIEGVNTGDLKRAEAVFAPEPQFRWFSDVGRNGLVSSRGTASDPYERSTIAEYLASMTTEKGSIALVEYRASPQLVDSHFLNMTFTLDRAGVAARGKGLVDCSTVLVVVMSIGGPPFTSTT